MVKGTKVNFKTNPLSGAFLRLPSLWLLLRAFFSFLEVKVLRCNKTHDHSLTQTKLGNMEKYPVCTIFYTSRHPDKPVRH